VLSREPRDEPRSSCGRTRDQHQMDINGGLMAVQETKVEAVADSYFQLGGRFFTRWNLLCEGKRAARWSHLEVSGQSVDPGLDKDKSEFAVFVFAVFLQMLPHLDRLLDHVVQIFWDLRSQAVHSQDPTNLILGDRLDLGNAGLIPAVIGW